METYTRIALLLGLLFIICYVFVIVTDRIGQRIKRKIRLKKEARLKQNDIVHIQLLDGCCVCQIKYIDRQERKVHFVNMESIKRDRLITDLNNVIL